MKDYKSGQTGSQLSWKELSKPEKNKLMRKNLEKMPKLGLYDLIYGYLKCELIDLIAEEVADYRGIDDVLGDKSPI